MRSDFKGHIMPYRVGQSGTVETLLAMQLINTWDGDSF